MFSKSKALIVAANQKDHLYASNVILVSLFLCLINGGHIHFLNIC